jgi:predicted phosphate transport protein (TIGR00153 family)
MRTFAKLFGRSPFVPLQTHMQKVAACVDKTVELFKAFSVGDFDEVEKLADIISHLEHEADQVKHDIQDHLPNGLFLAVDRARILEILATQDNIADKCENVAIQTTLKRLDVPEDMREDFEAFLEKNVEAFHTARQIIEQLDELLETGFGGVEAERVKQLVMDVSYQEHEGDLLQRKLLRTLYSLDDQFSGASFYLWSQIIRQVAELSNLSERLANRVRVTLELKK